MSCLGPEFRSIILAVPCAAPGQVSSFGVGGTNGHAIFWGEKAAAQSLRI